MSLALALERVAQIESMLSPAAPATATPLGAASATPSPTAVAATAGSGAFANVLQGALGSNAAGTGASAMVRIAEGEVGQAEMPPGSNDSPRIATYRQATAGSAVGPWCAYFVSWAAQQAGLALGDHGEGFGSVDQLYAWAQRAGRAVPNGQGYTPRPGDLIVFHEHVGMVENVLPNGQIQTIEGNSSDRVSRNVRGANEAVGYVRMS